MVERHPRPSVSCRLGQAGLQEMYAVTKCRRHRVGHGEGQDGAGGAEIRLSMLKLPQASGDRQEGRRGRPAS